MKFKLDENFPVEAAELIRRSGHDVMTVLEQGMGGAGDPEVIAACSREERVLATLDTDFADIRTYPPEASAGLLVFRLRRQDKVHVLNVLRRLLLVLAKEESLAGPLWIVEEERIRAYDRRSDA